MLPVTQVEATVAFIEKALVDVQGGSAKGVVAG
jgi:hypothetical protein